MANDRVVSKESTGHGNRGSASPDDENPTSTHADSMIRAIADIAWAQIVNTDRGERFGMRPPTAQIQINLTAERIPDISFKAARKRSIFARGVLARLKRVPREALSDDGQVTYGALSHLYGYQAEEDKYYWVDFDIVPYKTNRALAVFTEALRANDLASAEKRACYIRLLEAYSNYFRQQRVKLEGQANRGIRLPKEAVESTRTMYAAIAVTLERDLFEERFSHTASDDMTAFAAKVLSVVRVQVAVSIARLVAFLGEEYLARAPNSVGLGQYPRGNAQYRRLIKAFTTLRLEPSELHKLGLHRVEEISAEIVEKAHGVGLDGDLQKIFNTLRDNPRFRATSPEDVHALYTADVAKIAPFVSAYFMRVPSAPYGVKRLTPAAEKVLTYGSYYPPTLEEPRGLYFYNASDLDHRTMLTHSALIYHELVPGHHFQIALQQENESLHPVRRRFAPSGFIEGWAEYAASLAYEMGLYGDPFDDIGRKVMELFFAMRLVVDTGMAEYGWSLSQARTYMREHIFQSAAEIDTESLRYAVWPAQALCYYVGYSTIWRLRHHAEQSLGNRFSLPRFHDLVIGAGSLCLDVLQMRVERYIALTLAAQAC
jgi:uncharacterized protein (DUF885 family)